MVRGDYRGDKRGEFEGGEKGTIKGARRGDGKFLGNLFSDSWIFGIIKLAGST